MRIFDYCQALSNLYLSLKQSFNVYELITLTRIKPKLLSDDNGEHVKKGKRPPCSQDNRCGLRRRNERFSLAEQLQVGEHISGRERWHHRFRDQFAIVRH